MAVHLSFHRFAAVVVICAILQGCRSSGSSAKSGSNVAINKPAASMRVMTYNIRHTLGDDGKCDPARIAGIISREHPDLVAVQEVDVKTDRIAGVNTAAELGRLTGMNVRFGKAIDYQHGEYGQVILSKFPIVDATVHKLPGTPTKEQRIAFAAMIDLGNGERLRIVSTHFDHVATSNDRIDQANKLVELFAGPDGPPTIIAGDFNSTPGSDTQQILAKAFVDTSGTRPPTFPASQPVRKIDWIFVRKSESWTPQNAAVVDGVDLKTASDHRPIVVDLIRNAPNPLP